MRKKWIPLLVIALLVISPFSTVNEVYAMSNNQSKLSQHGDDNKEEDYNRIITEHDVQANEVKSEEMFFQLGDEDETIQELKEALTELGFAALEDPTEYFGLHTEESVKSFQKFHDIEETGIVDEDTLLTIEDILSEDAFNREEHLEFSMPEEFVTEEEEIEQDSETEEEHGTETEEGSETEEGQGTETEEGSETEEEQGTETEEGSETEEEQGTETEEGSETEEEHGTETEEGSETEEEHGTETEEGSETEEEQGTGTVRQQGLTSNAQSSYQRGDRHANRRRLRN
ncbi:peptidoglycan-binding domain-containing protein [Oceanobacillus sp. FSL W7-1293]|uniref:peptidoglycan-binding domain-containing protein n=1 Tax=Oceanobacillus sp. FSL W7-1293 TaxID=2921699 RepID=UPI0030CEBE60